MERKTMRANRVVVAGLLWACAGGACAAAPRAGAQGIPDTPPVSWSIPDDSVEALFGRDNLVMVHERTSGPYPANLVMLRFRENATPAQRARAVAAVHGSLVGGNGVYYFVLVQAECADRPVWCAIDALEPLPQVEKAHPYLYGVAPASPG